MKQTIDYLSEDHLKAEQARKDAMKARKEGKHTRIAKMLKNLMTV